MAQWPKSKHRCKTRAKGERSWPRPVQQPARRGVQPSESPHLPAEGSSRAPLDEVTATAYDVEAGSTTTVTQAATDGEDDADTALGATTPPNVTTLLHPTVQVRQNRLERNDVQVVVTKGMQANTRTRREKRGESNQKKQRRSPVHGIETLHLEMPGWGNAQPLEVTSQPQRAPTGDDEESAAMRGAWPRAPLTRLSNGVAKGGQSRARNA